MRPISCGDARQEAARRLFEPVEAHVEATLSAHLAVCDSCRVHADDIEEAARVLNHSTVSADLPPDLEARVLMAIRTQPVRPKRSVRRPITAVVAVALILVGTVTLVGGGPATPARSSTLSPLERFDYAAGTATVLGPGAGTRLHLVVSGLPSIDPSSAYAVWVGDGKDGWLRLGDFRSPSADNVYDLPSGGSDLELVKVTIERLDDAPIEPGLAVLTGRL